jgi:hypothetical protein
MHASPVPRASAWRVGALLAAALTFAACTDAPTNAEPSPLAGLSPATVFDSVGNTPPPPVGTAGPGTFHGTVLGPSLVGAGGDTLATAPRVAGARVAAIPVLGGTAPPFGPEEGAVITDANGRFQLPLLAGGEYIVTVTPRAGSIYGGVWSAATAHATSNDHPWWVVLWLM